MIGALYVAGCVAAVALAVLVAAAFVDAVIACVHRRINRHD